MADEFDYTRMWSGVYTPPRIGDEDGIYILDDERSVGRNTRIYDGCTRVMYDDAHPRTHPGGQRYPGPYGAGRASDRIGPTLGERRATARRKEGFDAAGDTAEYDYLDESGDPSGWERDEYIRGSRRFGHPGPRGMVTSARGGRPAVDDSAWDNRPYHYAPDTPNEYAHLYVDEKARGPPLFWSVPGYPGFRQVDRFEGAKKGGVELLELWKMLIFFVVVILVATWLTISAAEKRLKLEIELAIRDACGTKT